jgi:hypothetical protein
MGLGFESVIILSMSSWLDDEEMAQVTVTALVQFTTTTTIAVYEPLFNTLIDNDMKLGQLIVSGSIFEGIMHKTSVPPEFYDFFDFFRKVINRNGKFFFKTESGSCPKLKSLQAKIPEQLWTASNLDENATLSIGETFNLVCPDGLKISTDNDSFHDYDDLYTVGCTTLFQYNYPLYWPLCVKACNSCLPDAPERTGLVRIIPLNTIPSGQYGKYMCTDTSLGVDEVSG